MIWTSRDQVQNCTPNTDVPHLAVSSTPAEWESSGQTLFKHKRYLQAMHCFARASLPRMVAICEAFRLREVARAKVGVAPQKAQQEAFLTAADAFIASGNDAPQGKDKLQYYRNAADCYVRAEDDQKAADAYLDAQEYDIAVQRYRTVRLFDKILEILPEHSENISSVQHEPALVGEHAFTGEEILAAEKIQAAYRTYRKHHEAQTCAIGRGPKAQRNTIFIACLKNVYAASWGRTPYRTLYLWALPHLVVCLDKAISIVNDFRSQTIGLFLKGNHKHLDELGKQASRVK